jgi:Flp pilus assembly protein TadG
MMSSLSHRALRFLARLAAAKDGVQAVEFALVLPMLVALIFGIYEFGLAVWTQGMLDYAVEQASRCASINATTCSSATAIKSYASQQTAPLNLPTTVFSATTPTCGNLVSASYVFSFVGTMPIIQSTSLFPTSITLTSSSCYPL